MSLSVSARRVAALVENFDRSPAYSGLAEALRLLIGDGRIDADVRLPSERDLAPALRVSRTTVTRAYALLRESGYAVAKQGSGTRTRVPGGRMRALDRVFMPTIRNAGLIDLTTTAPTAPPEIAGAFAAAHADLAPYLAGTGYFPQGVARLREEIAAHHDAQGLPTHPDQVIVTNGAVSALALIAHTFTRPGDRVLVESPTFPNAVAAVRARGARVVPAAVDPGEHDIASLASTVRQARARMAYLVPDFHNPTGHLLDDEARARLATALADAGTLPVVDETAREMVLDPEVAAAMPLPFAAHSPDTITVTGVSKSRWGGLRVGWLRAPASKVDALVRQRVALDLGAPVLEQLVVAHLLRDRPSLDVTRARSREQRDALLAALAQHLPQWRVVAPAGGLTVWCELPSAHGSAVAEAALRRDVVITPGPTFAVNGGLDRFVRLPYVLDAETLREAVARLAQAWEEVRESTGPGTAGAVPGPVLVG